MKKQYFLMLITAVLIAIGVNILSPKPYFRYDIIEHYFNNISDDSISSLERSEHPSAKDTNLLKLLTWDYPEKVQDTSGLADLNKYGFKKTVLSGGKPGQVNALFSNRIRLAGEDVAACIPVYRDILIFKRKGKITGVAKICFTCHQYSFMGATRSVESFGKGDDFDKLYRILH